MSVLARRLAANLSFLFQDLPFLDRFAAAADAGFTAVEFLFPYDHPADELARRLAANGLELSLFNAPPGDWAAGERGLAALSGRRDEFRAGIARALDYAAALGAKQFHVMAGLAEPDDPEAMGAYRENLAWAAEAANRRDVQVLIEPINGGDMPGYFLRDFDVAAEIVLDLIIGLQFDIYHCQKIHGAVLDRLDALLPITAHMQIAGVPGRNEPSPQTLPLREIFARLDERGYRGRVGCEYRPAGGTVEGLAWAAGL